MRLKYAVRSLTVVAILLAFVPGLQLPIWVRAIQIGLIGLSFLMIMGKFWRRWNGERQSGATAGNAAQAGLIDMVPGRLQTLYRAERKAYFGAMCALGILRSPVEGAVTPGGLAQFSVHKGSKYGLLLPMLILVAATDAPITLLLISGHVDSTSWRLILYGFSALSLAYLFVWVLGDRWWMKRTGIACAEQGLQLTLGLRLAFHINWRDVAHVSVQRTSRRETPEGFLRATPLDTPNVLIQLQGATEVAVKGVLRDQVMTCNGVTLYADDPKALVAAALQRMHARSTDPLPKG